MRDSIGLYGLQAIYTCKLCSIGKMLKCFCTCCSTYKQHLFSFLRCYGNIASKLISPSYIYQSYYFRKIWKPTALVYHHFHLQALENIPEDQTRIDFQILESTNVKILLWSTITLNTLSWVFLLRGLPRLWRKNSRFLNHHLKKKKKGGG